MRQFVAPIRRLFSRAFSTCLSKKSLLPLHCLVGLQVSAQKKGSQFTGDLLNFYGISAFKRELEGDSHERGAAGAGGFYFGADGVIPIDSLTFSTKASVLSFSLSSGKRSNFWTSSNILDLLITCWLMD